MEETKPCPYCGEEIRSAATRCRYCRSRVTAFDPEGWHRDHPERRLAGVAAAVGRALALPIAVARLGFIVLTFFHLLGPVIYGALWLLVPFAPGGRSPLERAAAWARTLTAGLGNGRTSPRNGSEPPAPPASRSAAHGMSGVPLP